MYNQLDENDAESSRPEPSGEQKKVLEKVFDESKALCDELGLPRSFSLPSSSYKFNTKSWWTDKLRKKYGNEDGMMSAEEFRTAAKAPKPTNESNSAREKTAEEKTARDNFIYGDSSGPKFVEHEVARPNKQTKDGCRMVAAKKIGKTCWLIIVEEESGGHRFRSGAECGGPSYTTGIVEDLPRLSTRDSELLKRETDRLASGQTSFFKTVTVIP